MKKARAYVDNWKKACRDNTLFLLFVDVGMGNFFSGYIANALLDWGISVLMINFPSILNRLDGMFSEDREDFIASQGRHDLLTLNALGARIPSTQ